MFVLFFNFTMFFLSSFSIHLEKTTFLFGAIPPQNISATQAASNVVYFNNGILVSLPDYGIELRTV